MKKLLSVVLAVSMLLSLCTAFTASAEEATNNIPSTEVDETIYATIDGFKVKYNLNNVNNLIDSANSIKKHGLDHEVTITMMELPYGCEGAHDVAFYEKVLSYAIRAYPNIEEYMELSKFPKFEI